MPRSLLAALFCAAYFFACPKFVPDAAADPPSLTCCAGHTGPPSVPELLQRFPLDTLKMVGTQEVSGHLVGLVQTQDGQVHPVNVGDHMGQADGRITKITPSEINLIETVPDGRGGYVERPNALTLN